MTQERRRRLRRLEDERPQSGLLAFGLGVVYGALLAAAIAAWLPR